MVDPASPPRSTWRQFVASHAHEMLAIDFTTQVLWNYATRHVLVVMAIASREIVHVAVTGAPTLDWVKQQIREATAWDRVPRFLLHDNDAIFGQFRAGRRTGCGVSGRRYRCALDAWLDGVLGIKGIPIPYGAPNASAHIERFIGTLKRECLNHFVFFSEDRLRRTVADFVAYYNGGRPNRGIDGIPKYGAGLGPPRKAAPDGPAKLVARPILGGLIHDYRLAA